MFQDSLLDQSMQNYLTKKISWTGQGKQGRRRVWRRRGKTGERGTGEPGQSSCDKTRKISLNITEGGSIRQTGGSHLKTQEKRGKTRGHNYAPLAALPSSS